MRLERNYLSEQDAIDIYNSGWWKDKTFFEIAERQLFERRLICPWSIFHEAIEKVLERGVWTHEFACPQHIYDEFNAKYPEDK